MKRIKTPHSILFLYILAALLLLDSCKCNEKLPDPICEQRGTILVNGECVCDESEGYEEIDGTCVLFQNDNPDFSYYKAILKNGNCADNTILRLYCDTSKITNTSGSGGYGITFGFYNTPEYPTDVVWTSNAIIGMYRESYGYSISAFGARYSSQIQLSCFPEKTVYISFDGTINSTMDTIRAHSDLFYVSGRRYDLGEFDQIYVRYK